MTGALLVVRDRAPYDKGQDGIRARWRSPV